MGGKRGGTLTHRLLGADHDIETWTALVTVQTLMERLWNTRQKLVSQCRQQ